MAVHQTRAFFDKKFGKGRWRAMPRFALWQVHNSKWRAIDNGKASLHNVYHVSAERVHTSSAAWVAAVSRRFHRHKEPLQVVGIFLAKIFTHQCKFLCTLVVLSLLRVMTVRAKRNQQSWLPLRSQRVQEALENS